jgi:hypothetical protein
MGCNKLMTAKQLKTHTCQPVSTRKNKYADAPRTKTVGSFGAALADAFDRKS